jgi:hypothetical protein
VNRLVHQPSCNYAISQYRTLPVPTASHCRTLGRDKGILLPAFPYFCPPDNSAAGGF